MRGLVVLWLGTTLLLTASAGAGELTLDRCLRIAVRENRGLAADRARVSRAEGTVVEARSGRYPRVDFRSGYLRIEDPPRLSFLGQSFELGRSDAYFADLGVEQPLYTGGAVTAAIGSSEAARRAVEQEHAAAREEVALGVHRAFYGALFARELVGVREASLEQLERHLGDAREGLRQGTKSEFELLRAEVEVANHRPLLVQARHGLEDAKDHLGRIMGIDLSRPLSLRGVLEVEPAGGGEAPSGESRRPELAAALAREEAAEARAERARAFRFPTVSWFAHGLLSSPEYLVSNDSDPELNGIVGLAFRLPLFTGFETRGRVVQAEADLRRARELSRDLEREIELEVRRARRALEEASATLAAQARVLEQATKALEIAQVRYAEGLGTQLEVTDAQLALEEASVVRLRAVHDHAVARARVRRALGESLLPKEVRRVP